MDLQVYYQDIREVEAAIPTEFAVIVSLATKDGGREGVKTEVSRQIAARSVVEGRARLASEEEAREFYRRPADARPDIHRPKAKGGKD